MGERGGRTAASLGRVALPRGMRAHPHVAVGCVFALFVFVYLWPVLVGGRVLSPFALLYAFPPWTRFTPTDFQDYVNPLLFDVQAADYPWRSVVRALLHDGVFPAWNPNAFAGVPLYANPQTGLFSPFSLPLWILPLNYGIGFGAALKLWAGGFGTYLLVREHRLGVLPGLLAGVCFSFSAFNIVWLTHETLPAVVVMLPWMVWLIERVVGGGGVGSMLGLALVTAIAVGGGHPGAQLHVLAAAGAYAVLRAALDGAAPFRQRARGLALALGGLVLGTLAMAYMLLPEALSARDTIGLAARRNGGVLPGSHMPLTAIRTVAFPDWWGRPSATETPSAIDVLANYNERTFYVGSVGLLFAAMGLLDRRRWRRKAPFVVLGIVGLAIPLHAPVLYWLATHLPVFSDVQAQRMHFLFAFAVAVMAAFGLHGLLERPRGAWLRPLALIAALALTAYGFSLAGAQPGDAERVARHFLTGVDIPTPSVLALTSVVWFLLFVLAAGIGIAVAWRWPRLRGAVAGGVVLLALLDAYHFAHGYQPMTPARAIPPVTPAIAYLQRHAGTERITGIGGALVGESATAYGLRDIRGYAPPQPTERFYRLWQRSQPNQSLWREFSLLSFDAQAVRVASVLGSRWLVVPPNVIPSDLGRVAFEEDRSLRPLSVAYRGTDAVVLRNPNAVPRAMIPSSVALTGSELEVLDELAAPRFDPRRTAVVERGQPGGERLRPEGGRGRVAIVDDRNARVAVRATLERPGLVVLNDNWSHGWSVRVDGRPAPMLHVNEVMRGVVVSRGRHDVVWSYAVPGLKAGIALTAVALVAGAACAAFVTAAKRRGSRARSRRSARDSRG